MNVVIYARFSSHSQTEQSIEGQLKVCYEYAESNHYTVVGEYIDRAISGTTDNRAEFQRMISDSDRHTFEGVLVYQLDRFARNRYDSAINKAKLKKNGVRVLSAKENIADDASGILVEGVLESMAEYYSVELSQKIHRGMAINAEKCLSNGSNPGLGFKVDAERRFYVDEEEAAIVREIYERYASGETKAEIIRDLKRRRVKTSLGKEFSPNSLSHLLSNKRYIGVYLYKGKETPGGMPRILDDDLFYRVQSMMNKNKNAPARTHGEGEYLLTTKLFCGHCKEMMVGYGGTSKTGRQYHYYMCKNARRKKCGKKIVSKSYIEDRVVNECLKMLTEEKIHFIAKKVAEECAKSPDNLTAKALKKAIREADTAIENLWKAIEQGRAVEMLTERLNKRMAEKTELEAQLAIEENKKITLTEAQILAFLDYVCEMPADDVNKRRAIINIFVHSIYLYDDHFTLIINASKKPLSIDDVPLDDIETAFEGETGASEGCSSLNAPAPPQQKSCHVCDRIFCFVSFSCAARSLDRRRQEKEADVPIALQRRICHTGIRQRHKAETGGSYDGKDLLPERSGHDDRLHHPHAAQLSGPGPAERQQGRRRVAVYGGRSRPVFRTALHERRAADQTQRNRVRLSRCAQEGQRTDLRDPGSPGLPGGGQRHLRLLLRSDEASRRRRILL